VSLIVARGEIACLLGPNGAGKTTLIRTILGIVKPVAGSIWFEGERVDGRSTHRIVGRGIAVVPEGRRVFPRMTVEENLRMGAFIEWTPADLDRRREHVFSLFPRLAERRTQKAATMSGGEQAMLAMGRALMSRPKLLLLDEPSLGLSPILVEQLFEMVQTINRSGTTVFLVEQNARKTLSIAHHGFLLQKGEVIGRGTAAELAASEVVRHAYLRT
jgi:branched-chain amino acid transport system ATP-binding protein